MQIEINTASYNHRRMGKPWIAKVDFAASAKGDFAFGEWTGDHYNGSEGVLTISANPGDIIAKGQKDHRQPRNSAPEFYVCGATGLDFLGDKGAAFKHFLALKKNSPDLNALRQERETLMLRVADIDKLLNN